MPTHSSSKTKPSKGTKKATVRPPKPREDFPLYAHPLGYWSKKINKKIIHFGRWGRVVNGQLERLPYEAGWKEALDSYKLRFEDAQAGRIQQFVVSSEQRHTGKFTMAYLCNAFLTSKQSDLDSGEIGQRMFDEYKTATDLLVKEFGKERAVEDLGAIDFERLRVVMAKRWGPVRLANQITYVKTVFKYAYSREIIDKPIRCLSKENDVLKKPAKAVFRKHEAKRDERLFSHEECRRLIDGAPVPLKAMILLGLNCGFGNHDVATLPLDKIDLKSRWLDYPRPKTGVQRRCYLWPETVKAIQDAIATRPKPKVGAKGASEALFLRASGCTWLCKDNANPVSLACRDLLKTLGFKGKRGLGFYTLRHTFRTVADDALDQVAANVIMGHVQKDMADIYRHGIKDSRIIAVTDHVRKWLFADAKKGAA